MQTVSLDKFVREVRISGVMMHRVKHQHILIKNDIIGRMNVIKDDSPIDAHLTTLKTSFCGASPPPIYLSALTTLKHTCKPPCPCQVDHTATFISAWLL